MAATPDGPQDYAWQTPLELQTAVLDSMRRTPLIELLCPTYGLTLAVGSPRVGKSNMLLDLACSSAYGRPAFGHFKVSKELKTVFISEEDTDEHIAKYASAFLEGHHLKPYKETVWNDFIENRVRFLIRRKWLPTPGVAWLKSQIARKLVFNPDLVIVDALRKLSRPGTNILLDQVQLNEVLDELRTFALDLKLSLILIHHPIQGATRKGWTSIDDTAGGLQTIAEAEHLWHITGRFKEKRTVTVLSKDLNQDVGHQFKFWWESEGAEHAPDWMRSYVELGTGKVTKGADHEADILRILPCYDRPRLDKEAYALLPNRARGEDLKWLQKLRAQAQKTGQVRKVEYINTETRHGNVYVRVPG